MKFTKSFLDKVYKLYPDNPFGIHEMIERGDPLVGRIIEDTKGKDPERIKLYTEFLDLLKIRNYERIIHKRKRPFSKE